MAGELREIDQALAAFLAEQRVFFVATAPTGAGGHVNCSPKGGDPLLVLGPTTVAWVDRFGSGVETVAHLRQNGRIVVMLCAFAGPPRIVRLHGRGRAVEPGDAEFAPLLQRCGGRRSGVRSIVVVEVARIANSCGFGVPLYDYRGERGRLAEWAEQKGEAGLRAYARAKNGASLDGLPALRRLDD